MANYRPVQTAFWGDSEVLDLTPEDKLFYLYILTNERTTQCGIYELPYQPMTIELGYTRETCVQLIKRFEGYGKIKYNEETKEIMVLNWLKHNWIRSHKTIACIVKELNTVKHKPFVNAYFALCEELGYTQDEVFIKNVPTALYVPLPRHYEAPSMHLGSGNEGGESVDNCTENGQNAPSMPLGEKEKELEKETKKEKQKESETEVVKNPTTSTPQEAGVKIWDACLRKLEQKLSKPSFETWFKNSRGINYENGTLIAEVSNDFARDWLESRYSVFIKETLTELSEGKEIAVKFVLAEQSAA